MLIDLSMPVNKDTIVFPGDAKPALEATGAFAEHDVVDHTMQINVHLGTHVDAPGHMLKGGNMLADYGVDRFVCDAICLDARNHKRLTVDLLKNVEIFAGMGVLFYTGAGDRYIEESYATDYPPIDQELASVLVEKRVGMVGVDMISFDHDAPFPIHKALLAHDILLIENLVRLDSVVGKHFKLYALPMNLQLEAAPARVVAEVSS